MRNHWILAVLLLLLAACGTAQSVTEVPKASTSSPDQLGESAPPTAATNALCAIATLDDVQAVLGGTIATIDVIDEADLDYVDCVYLDSQNVTNGMTVRYVTTEKLVRTNSQWATAAAYFAEWTRGGTPVVGLGQGAVWEADNASLWVLTEDTVIELSSSSADTAAAAIRAKFEGLAGLIVAHMP